MNKEKEIPAFARSAGPIPGARDELQTGMSLRDYFAAAALQGIVSNPDNSGSFDNIAKEAYRFADTMIEKRQEWYDLDTPIPYELTKKKRAQE